MNDLQESQIQVKRKVVPARLFAILAREAHVAVILRRGPSNWVQVILWHVDTDVFEFGQWFRGRIFERRCDLSPDGTRFVYFARKMSGRTINDAEYTYSWTAISKPPYLTALALWPKGDSWNGGGLFINNNILWLNHGKETSKPHKGHKPKRLKVRASIDYRGEDDSIYDKRLERDNWLKITDGVWPREFWPKCMAIEPEVWRKYNKDRSAYIEVKTVGYDSKRVGAGSAVYLFSAYSEESGHEVALADATWADWDYRGRLVFTTLGKLYSAEHDNGYESTTVLGDFNSQEPYEMVAPDWAQQW